MRPTLDHLVIGSSVLLLFLDNHPKFIKTWNFEFWILSASCLWKNALKVERIIDIELVVISSKWEVFRVQDRVCTKEVRPFLNFIGIIWVFKVILPCNWYLSIYYGKAILKRIPLQPFTSFDTMLHAILI